MVKSVNTANEGNAPAVQMNIFLESHKKLAVLVGQCMTIITYERRKNVLLGVTGISTAYIVALFKKKISFLQKHDKVLFGKEFIENLAETIKVKKQFIEAITKVSKPIIQ